MEEEGGRMSWVVNKGEQRGTQNARRIQCVLPTVKMEEGNQELITWTVFRSWTSAQLIARKKPVSQWRNWTLPTTEMSREIYVHLQSLQKGAQPCQPLVLALCVHKQRLYWARVPTFFKSEICHREWMQHSWQVSVGEVEVWCGWQAFFLVVQYMTKAEDPRGAQHWQWAFAKLH